MDDAKKKSTGATLMTYKQIAEMSNLGLNTVMRLARESGALVKIGRIARVNPAIFFSYIENVYTVQQ